MDPHAFELNRAKVNEGVELAYVREGVGGVPLLMLHGWPATKRIFYRNVGPLAGAGFEVIAPDVSGWGDSPVGERYADPISSAHDFKSLMEQLGHERWVLAAFDFGSMTGMHMINRFPGQIVRQVLWNAVVPLLGEEYERAGVGGNMLTENTEVSDHVVDHGTDPDAFAAAFETDEQRRRYVMGFYQGRVWKKRGPRRNLASPASFDDEAAAFHASAFEDAATFRASLSYYAPLVHPEQFFEAPMLDRRIQTETMFLFGQDDEILGRVLTRRAEIGFADLTGPFHVDRGGHFLSWERPDVVNNAIRCFCRDLLPAR